MIIYNTRVTIRKLYTVPRHGGKHPRKDKSDLLEKVWFSHQTADRVSGLARAELLCSSWANKTLLSGMWNQQLMARACSGFLGASSARRPSECAGHKGRSCKQAWWLSEGVQALGAWTGGLQSSHCAGWFSVPRGQWKSYHLQANTVGSHRDHLLGMWCLGPYALSFLFNISCLWRNIVHHLTTNMSLTFPNSNIKCNLGIKK